MILSFNCYPSITLKECTSRRAFVCEKVHEPTQSPLVRYFQLINDTLDDHGTELELLERLHNLTRTEIIASKVTVLGLFKNGTDKVSIVAAHELIQDFNIEFAGALLGVEVLNQTLKKSKSKLLDRFQQIHKNFTKITNDNKQYLTSKFTDLLSTVYANSQKQNDTSNAFSQINGNFKDLKTFVLSINSRNSQQFAEHNRGTYARVLNLTIAFQQNDGK